ncbi:MAG: hypothetical protein JXA93_25950 [Anaerolineae bacterium]|nr:hypothetical protein [Anaerolineae bacterium]
MQENYPVVPTDERLDVEPPEPQGKSNTGRNIAIIAGVIVILALVILSIYGMATHPGVTEVIRDIAIIVLALVSIVIGVFIVILTIQVWLLTRLVQDEIKPILESTQRTVNTLRGTTTFMSEKITKPAIEAASIAAGISASVRQGVSLLRGNGRRKRGKS